MLKVQSYINCVSHSLLALIDAHNSSKDNIFITLTKDEQEFLRYQIISNIKNNIQFGYKNILIRSCSPKNNWRANDRGKAIKSFKILIDKDSSNYIKMDISKFEYFLNQFWIKKIPKLIPNIALIDDISMDTTDILKCINNIFPYDGFINDQYYNILLDGNKDYSHDKKIPEYLQFNIQQKLRGYNLIS